MMVSEGLGQNPPGRGGVGEIIPALQSISPAVRSD